MKVRTSEEPQPPVTSCSGWGWIFTHHPKGEGRVETSAMTGLDLKENRAPPGRDGGASLLCSCDPHLGGLAHPW